MAKKKRPSPSRSRKPVKTKTGNPTRTRVAPPPAEPAVPETTALAVRTATPERAFAGRVKPAAAPAPLPTGRRAIFVDVENSSRADHIGRVLDHLAIDRADRRVDLIAVGNWRVIGADSARLLARRGAQLVHSAPSTGVRDWSDLRIAVSAGVWLGGGRPGDLIEIISDDRAFDAVGDVAAVLGVEYRRLSYRNLSGVTPAAEEAPAPETAAPREGRGGRRGGRGRRRGGRGGRSRFDQGGRSPMPPRHTTPSQPARAPEPARAQAEPDAHTAPHDELVEVVRELADHAPNGAVLIDTLARALKERGFSRPPGSPRLITRLRRIRQLVVSQTGRITLADAGRPVSVLTHEVPPPDAEMEPAEIALDASGDEAAPDDEASPGNEATPGNELSPSPEAPQRSRRRRRRRGGRGRGRGRGGGGAGGSGGAAEPVPAPA
jgi:uncharacterized membrane protein YgcG